MGDKFGKKLNHIWQAITEQTEALRAFITDFKQQSEVNTKKIDDALQGLPKPPDYQKVEGKVEVNNLYIELERYFDQAQLKIDFEPTSFPELMKIAGQVEITNLDALAQLLAKAMPVLDPERPPLEWPNEPLEIFGNVFAAFRSAQPVYLTENGKAISLTKLLENVANAAASGGGTVVSGGGGWPDFNGLVPITYDYIQAIPHADRPETVIYKKNGATGATVATLTITYDGTTDRILTASRS